MSLDFDTVAGQLYGGPRDEFIATRAVKAAQAKSAGDRELAARIGGLRKPSIAAWLVNQLARRYSDELADLAALGEQLRSAHADLDGARLRSLSTQRRSTVEALTDRARSIGAEAGNPPGESVLDQVAGTLEAALADATTAAAVAEGRLDTAITPSGFDQWLVAPVGSAPTRESRVPDRESRVPDRESRVPDGESGVPASQRRSAEAEQRERQRQERLARATEEASAAAAARDRAERELAAATEAAEAAADEAAELRSRLNAAERTVHKRRAAAGEARRAYDAAVRASAAAERALQRLELR